MQWGTPDTNGLYPWQLIQQRNVLEAQHLLVFRQLKKDLWADYMGKFYLVGLDRLLC